MRRKADAATGTIGSSVPDNFISSFGAGRSLDRTTRDYFEPRFGADFSHVRVHAGQQAAESADAINARAYTLGSNVVFGAGQYRPETEQGKMLLAHELTHVIQQKSSNSLCRSEIIQRHPGPPCPPPPYRPIDARDRSIWGPANDVIEQTYRDNYPNNVVITGSQFEYGGRPDRAREIRLPRATPQRRAGNELLERLRGTSRQLAPDIMDFTERVFYEIKTPAYAAQGAGQLAGYYRIADAIQREVGGPGWHQEFATWFPEHVLPFPGDANRLVCTQLTTHLEPLTGLILYQVLERETDDGERERQAVALQQTVPVLTELAPEIESLSPGIQSGLREKIGAAAAGTEYVIIAPFEIYEALIGGPRMERTVDRMRVHGLDPRRSPVMGYRNLAWTLIGISAATMAVALYAPLVAELATAAAPAATIAASAAPPAAGGTVIPLVIRAAQTPAVQELARAASVLIVIGISNNADAQPETISRTGGIHAVPLAEVTGRRAGPVHLDSEVLFRGQRYIVIGRARAGMPPQVRESR